MNCRCPYCSTRLHIDNRREPVYCPYCFTTFRPCDHRPFPSWIWGVVVFLAANALLRLFY